MNFDLSKMYSNALEEVKRERKIKNARVVINTLLIIAMFFYIFGLSRACSVQDEINYGIDNVVFRATDKISYMDEEDGEEVYVSVVYLYVFTKSPKGLRDIVFDIRFYGKNNTAIFSEQNLKKKGMNIKQNGELTIELSVISHKPDERTLKLFNAEFKDLTVELKIRELVFGDGHSEKIY